jgi:hydrogenase maturation protease
MTIDALEPPVLVVGIGNELFGDDAIGPYATRIVASWRRPQVTTLVVGELLPELATHLSRFRSAVFVDAARGPPNSEVALTPLAANPQPPSLLHGLTPQALLAMGELLGHVVPAAWLLAVPGEEFDLREGFSDTARRGIDPALALLARLLPAEGALVTI